MRQFIQRTLLVFVMLFGAGTLQAQTSAFTYQGKVNADGAPANGLYDFMFRLMNDPTNGSAAPVIPIHLAVPVSNGLFITTMDFGAENIDGANLWLEVNVRTNGADTFATLSPRQFLASTPYAVRAISASNLLGTLPASQLSGTISAGQLGGAYSGAMALNNAGNSFSGDGAGLANVNAATLGGLTASNFWNLGGNAGTTSNNFLGTTDNHALEFKVNGQRALRIEPKTAVPNIIGGSAANVVLTTNLTGGNFIGGGTSNTIGAPEISTWHFPQFTNLITNIYLKSVAFGTIGGGLGNNMGGNLSFIGGGSFNSAGGTNATISGGVSNNIGFPNTFAATIGGGRRNTIYSGPEYVNIANTIGGGESNRIAGGGESPTSDCTIGGGFNNFIGDSSSNATIGGGANNFIDGNTSTIGGGYGNKMEFWTRSSVIAGGVYNLVGATTMYASIGGGRSNHVWGGDFGTIAGGELNQALEQYATVGGGRSNMATLYGAVAGGQYNFAGSGGFVGAGAFNRSGSSSVIGGGRSNLDSGLYSAIGGGRMNTISNTGYFVYNNGSPSGYIYQNFDNVIAGGCMNTIVGSNAFIAGGSFNYAGNYGFAGGHRAKALHQGAFVWADSQDADFASTTNDQFNIRAQGGVVIASGGAGANQTVSWSPGDASWSFTSDRNTKEQFVPISGQEVLEKVVQLPISEWNYKGYPQRHIGVMAQDFHAQFALNANDKILNSADLDGVALAAIQGLNQKLQEKETEITSLKKRLERLERMMDTAAKESFGR